jgi:FAD/FMN-containing dehydrogenase
VNAIAYAHAAEQAAAPDAERQAYDFVLTLRHAAARRPAPPLRILTADDAALAVRHAVDEGLAIELGNRPTEYALTLDLSGMKRIVIDPRKRTARVQPGATVLELERAAAPYGLAPLLDGGRFDAAGLLAAHVVTRDGSILRASEETPELLQLVREGALLGFVVDSTYRLHDAGDLRR